ncbi:MAG: hypothetical protein HC815_38175 [Richelia sp. RM1_1_1]|nr:hypothetical protein [Richelia sp. RM1_1_1]
MTRTKKPDIYTKTEPGALPPRMAVNLEKLTDRGIARLLLIQLTFYTFIWAAVTVTSALGCTVAKILSKSEILMLRWLGCSAGVKGAY